MASACLRAMNISNFSRAFVWLCKRRSTGSF